MANLRETIRPSADLRNHYNEITKQCREDKEAVIITVHGKGDTVSLSFEEYQNMKTTEIAKEEKRRIEETISEYEPKEA